VYDEVTRQASEHINEKDIILTYGQSDLLTEFLIHASGEGKK
jgi:translation initiation factor 2B subunit (eIF-2B alpha/beta/delta family)